MRDCGGKVQAASALQVQLRPHLQRDGVIVELMLLVEVSAGGESQQQFAVRFQTVPDESLRPCRKADAGRFLRIFVEVEIADDGFQRSGTGSTVDVAVRSDRHPEAAANRPLRIQRLSIETDQLLHRWWQADRLSRA